jgi:hypothetical protein
MAGLRVMKENLSQFIKNPRHWVPCLSMSSYATTTYDLNIDELPERRARRQLQNEWNIKTNFWKTSEDGHTIVGKATLL